MEGHRYIMWFNGIKSTFRKCFYVLEYSSIYEFTGLFIV